MIKTQAIFQIGKNGVTQGVVDSLALSVKKHSQVRISVLKSSSAREREGVKKVASEIISRLPFNCKAKIIGFTIILKKQSSFKKKQ